MTARRYQVAGRTFVKVAADTGIHVVEAGCFWSGDRSWEHRAVCGRSVVGTPVSLKRVDCEDCRAAIEAVKITVAGQTGGEVA